MSSIYWINGTTKLGSSFRSGPFIARVEAERAMVELCKRPDVQPGVWLKQEPVEEETDE